MQGRSQVDHARIAPQCGIVADAFRSLRVQYRVLYSSLSGSLSPYLSGTGTVQYSTVLYPVLYEFTPPPPGRRGEITIAVAVDGIEVRRFGDLWGRTEVGPMPGAQRPMELTEGRKPESGV